MAIAGVEKSSAIAFSPVNSLLDETLDAKQTHTYHLSLQLGLDHVAYCLLNTATNKFAALESYSIQGIHHYTLLAEQFSAFAKQHPWLKHSYKSVSVAIIHPQSTLVPSPLFDESKKEELLNFNQHSEPDETVIYDNLKNLEAKNVYILNKSISKVLGDLYPIFKLIHFSSPLIENTLVRYKNHPGKRVIVHIQSGHLEILIIEGKKLHFYNSFNYQAAEDVAYYILYICDLFKQNPESSEVTVYGEIERTSAIYNLLYKYIRNVKFGEPADQFEYSYKFKTLSGHFYYNILTQHLV